MGVSKRLACSAGRIGLRKVVAGGGVGVGSRVAVRVGDLRKLIEAVIRDMRRVPVRISLACEVASEIVRKSHGRARGIGDQGEGAVGVVGQGGDLPQRIGALREVAFGIGGGACDSTAGIGRGEAVASGIVDVDSRAALGTGEAGHLAEGVRGGGRGVTQGVGCVGDNTEPEGMPAGPRPPSGAVTCAVVLSGLSVTVVRHPAGSM